MTRCETCGAWIEPAYGIYPPAAHAGRAGTISDPRAPGDHDNICDVCDYGNPPPQHPHDTTTTDAQPTLGGAR